MAIQDIPRSTTETAPNELPQRREYSTEEAAELDTKLCEAIEAAKAAENEYLAELLANELGSHYYGAR